MNDLVELGLPSLERLLPLSAVSSKSLAEIAHFENGQSLCKLKAVRAAARVQAVRNSDQKASDGKYRGWCHRARCGSEPVALGTIPIAHGGGECQQERLGVREGWIGQGRAELRVSIWRHK